MDGNERRQASRHDMEIGVTISVDNSRIEARLIDIGGGGVGVIAEKAIDPGREVSIAIDEIGGYVVQGVVKWFYPYHEMKKACYRMGIETKCIVVNNESETNPSETSDLIAKLKMETGKVPDSPDAARNGNGYRISLFRDRDNSESGRIRRDGGQDPGNGIRVRR